MACSDQVNTTDLENANVDAITIAEVANSRAGGEPGGALIDSSITRLGDTFSTLRGQLAKLGYEVPLAYTTGIVFTVDDGAKTVDEGGIIYAPRIDALPLTTTGTWATDSASFYVVQNTAGLSSYIVETYSELDAIPSQSTGNVITVTGEGIAGDWVVDDGVHTANVGTIRDFTNAVGNQYLRRLDSSPANPKWFGAVGDGIFDDTSAIQLSFDSSENIVFDAGDYLITGEITVTSNISCDFGGSNFLGAGFFVFQGSAAILGNQLNATASEGDTTLSINNSGLEVGDIIILQNTAIGSFSPIRDYYYDGEWLEVISSDATTVYLNSALKTSYSVIGSVDVIKVNPLMARVKNANFSVSGTQAIKMTLCANSSASDITGNCTGIYGVYVDRCFETHLRAVNFKQNPAFSGGTDYGVVVGNSQKVSVKQSKLFGVRHAFATGGLDTIGSVPNRDIVVEDVDGFSTDSHSLDVHGNADGVVFNRCNAYNGYGIGGANISIYGGFSERTDGTSGQSIMLVELAGGNIHVENVKSRLNASYFCGYSSASVAGISLQRPFHLKFVNCDIDVNQYTGIAIFVLGNYGDPSLVTEWGHDIKGIRIKNGSLIQRIVSNNTATTAGQPLQPVPASYLKLDDVDIDDSGALTHWIQSDVDGYAAGTVVTSPSSFAKGSLSVLNGQSISSGALTINYPITCNIKPPIFHCHEGSDAAGGTWLFTLLVSSSTTSANIFLGTGHTSETVTTDKTLECTAYTNIKDYVI